MIDGRHPPEPPQNANRAASEALADAVNHGSAATVQFRADRRSTFAVVRR
jgi:hypothetical protein